MISSQIDRYWSEQRNNEIYLRGKTVMRGSHEYWQIIERERFKYLYYLPDILKFFKAGRGRDMLEVGCGMGVDLGYFIQHGFNGTGVDLATEHLRLARQYFDFKGMSVPLDRQNAEKLMFPDNSFDCVYSFGVLHHTQNPQKGVDEIHRVLLPGGRCVVMLYHRHSLNNLVHVLLRLPYDNPKNCRVGAPDANFVHRYSRSEVRQMFCKFQQVNVSVEYLYGSGWEPVYSWTPQRLYRKLSKKIGWHLVIKGLK